MGWQDDIIAHSKCLFTTTWNLLKILGSIQTNANFTFHTARKALRDNCFVKPPERRDRRKRAANAKSGTSG